MKSTRRIQAEEKRDKRNIVVEKLQKALKQAEKEGNDEFVDGINRLINGGVSEVKVEEDKEKVDLMIINGKLEKEVRDLRAKLDVAEKSELLSADFDEKETKEVKESKKSKKNKNKATDSNEVDPEDDALENDDNK